MFLIDKIKQLFKSDLYDVQKKAQDRSPYTDEFFNERLEELKTRVDEKRYKHTLGVIEMAERLCDIYHIDKQKARLAATLHDWDKCYSDDDMRKRIYEVGADKMVSKDIIEEMPKVLHGVTAAFALGVEYPNIPSDVLKAVMNHTTAAKRMSRLDMVIYIADALDPNRDYPEYNKLVHLMDKISLEDLFCKVFAESVIAVIKKEQTLHPNTVAIWNKNVEMYQARHSN